MQTMKKLVVGNWKNYVTTGEAAETLAKDYGELKAPQGVTLVVCPPSQYLGLVKDKIGMVTLGTQNTFDISGAEYIILGHSDYRAAGETNDMVLEKVRRALQADLEVILCVGEERSVRDDGVQASIDFVLAELWASLPSDLPDAKYWKLNIAYEPIWAISRNGQGQSDTPEQAVEIISAIREATCAKLHVNVRVLYGGSINSANAKDFISRPEIDGALVGHASTNAEEFQKIIDAAGE